LPFVRLGAEDGAGDVVGSEDGSDDGDPLGWLDGSEDGSDDGSEEGLLLGALLGWLDGSEDGLSLGALLVDGSNDSIVGPISGGKASLTQRKCVCDKGGRNEEKSLRTSDEGQTLPNREWIVA